MVDDNSIDDKLKGQPFIGKTVTYSNPQEEWMRICENCFYRRGEKNPKQDCQVVMRPDEKSPKELFGIEPDKVLPKQLDGKEVGNYCPCFLPWTIEFYE